MKEKLEALARQLYADLQVAGTRDQCLQKLAQAKILLLEETFQQLNPTLQEQLNHRLSTLQTKFGNFSLNDLQPYA